MKKSAVLLSVLMVLTGSACAAGGEDREITCTLDAPKEKMSLRHEPPEIAMDEAMISHIFLSLGKPQAFITGELMTPHAGYTWAVENVEHAFDHVTVTVKLHDLQEGMMGAMVITPVKISIPVTLPAQTHTVALKVTGSPWGTQGYTCPLGK